HFERSSKKQSRKRPLPEEVAYAMVFRFANAGLPARHGLETRATVDSPARQLNVPPMQARVFVTGASGFVGSAVVDELLARRHPVHALVNRRPVRDEVH